MNRLALEEKVEAGGGPVEADLPVIRIEPRTGWLTVNWSELWQYREMLYFLTWRDIKVRYKQTVLGATWAVLQPVLSMVVFTIFFGRLAGIQSDGLPYPIFNYAGMLAWTLFAGVVTTAAGSLIGNERLVTKIYFPRLIIPWAAVGVALVDLAVAFAFLGGMMVYYQILFGPGILLLPIVLILILAAALGVGMFLCALNVEYRDFKYVVPFLMQLWMFASPVVYPSSLVPEKYQAWFALNPMVGLIEGFRAALLGRPIPWNLLAVSAGICVALFLAGTAYFRRTEWKFADVI